MTDDAPQIRRGRKFDQVLAGAREVFLRHGFEGASVDDIAKAAGVSKATLYSYFPDKRLLFLEVARSECRRQAAEADALLDPSAPPRVVLTQAAQRLIAFAASDFAQKMFRICVAEAERFPEIGQEFYRSGPAVARERLVEYLGKAAARGELQIGDLALAADQFVVLCKGSLQERLMFGMATTCSPAETRARISAAVDMFMARYAPQAQ